MSLSDFEIGKIAAIVVGKSGTQLDAKALRQVIDRVVDQLNAERGNPEIEGVTCEVSRPPESGHSREGNNPSSVGGPQLAVGSDMDTEPVGGPPFRVGSDKPTINGGAPSQKPPGSQLPLPDEALTETHGGLYEQIENTEKTRVIIATFGKDRPGVAAALTQVLGECNCSIEDISQTLLQDFFSMIMIVNIDGSTVDFSGLRDRLQQAETQLGMKVYVMHEDIFRYMHRI